MIERLSLNDVPEIQLGIVLEAHMAIFLMRVEKLHKRREHRNMPRILLAGDIRRRKQPPRQSGQVEHLFVGE